MLIVLDAGHGGKDSGAIGSRGLKEKDVVLEIVLELGKLLLNKGIDVVYTRKNDTFIELGDRAKFANQKKADYFISIHINSATNSIANGIETYIYMKEKKSEALAQKVQDALIEATNLPNRGVKIGDLAVLRETYMPAILVEVGFISHREQEELLRSETFIQKVAKAITKGVCEALGIKVEDTVPWGGKEIEELKKLGLITEDKDRNAYVTWAEFATVILRLKKMLE